MPAKTSAHRLSCSRHPARRHQAAARPRSTTNRVRQSEAQAKARLQERAAELAQTQAIISAELTTVDPSLPPRTVVQDRPARDGVTMIVVRRGDDHTGALVTNDTFISRYAPQGALFRVSPNMASA